jgi:hypothetical protein
MTFALGTEPTWFWFWNTHFKNYHQSSILEVDVIKHVMVFLRQSMAQSEHTKPWNLFWIQTADKTLLKETRLICSNYVSGAGLASSVWGEWRAWGSTHRPPNLQEATVSPLRRVLSRPAVSPGEFKTDGRDHAYQSKLKYYPTMPRTTT